jgi:hypothetical protein
MSSLNSAVDIDEVFWTYKQIATPLFAAVIDNPFNSINLATPARRDPVWTLSPAFGVAACGWLR